MFIARGVLSDMNRPAKEQFETFIQEMEDSLGAPIRVMTPGEGRKPDPTIAWRGNGSNVENYTQATQPSDLTERGITILFNAWNSDISDGYPGTYQSNIEPEWFMEPERITANWGDAVAVGLTGPTEEQIVGAGGVPIFFGDRGRVGELYDRFIIFHATMYYLSRGIALNWDLCLRPSLEGSSDEEAREAARVRVQERQRVIFHDILYARGNMQIEQAEKDIAEKAVRLTTLQEQLVNERATVDQIQRHLRLLRQDETEITDDDIQRQWDLLLGHTKIQDIRLSKREMENPQTGQYVNTDILTVKTDPIWYTFPNNHGDYPGREILLGEYDVDLNFGVNTIRINRRAGLMNGSWNHPHVDSQGGLCAGTYATAITQFVRNRDITGMSGMLFNILQTVTLNDPWGEHIWMWVDDDDQIRNQQGLGSWSRDETEHPLKAQLAAA